MIRTILHSIAGFLTVLYLGLLIVVYNEYAESSALILEAKLVREFKFWVMLAVPFALLGFLFPPRRE